MAASSCCYSLTPGRILDFYNLQKKFYYFDHTECNMIRNQVDRLNRSNTCNTNLLSRSSGKVTHVIKVLQTQTTSLGAQKQDTYASTSKYRRRIRMHQPYVVLAFQQLLTSKYRSRKHMYRIQVALAFQLLLISKNVTMSIKLIGNKMY